jgi:hypothetical protein
MSTLEAMPAFSGLVTRFEQEVAGLEQQKTAAAQNLVALEATQAEMQARIAELLVELKAAEGKVAAALEHARQITANAERQAFGIVKAAQMDAEALREKGRVAVAKAQAAFEGMN